MADDLTRERVADDPETVEYWDTHCWGKRFLESADDAAFTACRKPATFRGPPDSPVLLVRAWRACDEHRQPSDVRLVPVIAPTGAETKGGDDAEG